MSEGASDDPGLIALRGHLHSATFLGHVDAGRWRADTPTWPTLMVDVFAEGGQVTLRFDLTGYPGQAPTASPWDRAGGTLLPTTRWPTGAAASRVFNPAWSAQQNWALYFPLDRCAANGHANWFTQSPSLRWSRDKTICDYLNYVCDVLRGATFPGE